MKNLRKKNPLLAALQDTLQRPATDWPELPLQTRIDCCAQFLLLPVLKKQAGLSVEMHDKIMPVAVDLERQASALLQDQPRLFKTIRDLLDKTTALFLMATEE